MVVMNKAGREASEETNTTDTLILVFLTSKMEGKSMSVFKALSLWYFIMEALAN